tara:strand:+ start:332 stop:2734 length:2403 start_codon:yes stop_codon:yes gene_type:complete
MKFTISWLKDHLNTSAELSVISETLTNIGLEVEHIENKAEEFKNFTVAKILSTEKHPDADRLKVCNVQSVEGIFQVVCGAPNAKVGMMGIFAPENTYIPGTKVNLKKSEIRGIESCGMLLSERELGISDEHDGIIELKGDYKIGDHASTLYGFDDPVIEINLTPNRSDCLSVRGIARDLAATGLGKLRELKIKKIKGNFISDVKWLRKFNKEEDHLCPGVSGRLIRNVKNLESPDWLKRRLTLIGLRPISALVDISNYITFDLGRPLHVYDADKINGNLMMRKAQQNEKCKTLDEKEHTLSNEMIVISDNNSLHGIGGIMGGTESGCSLETKNVFLEVALFDPISITKTGRKLNLQSDARYRFERGVDSSSIEWGIDIVTQMIMSLCGGDASEVVTNKIKNKQLKTINYDTKLTRSRGGIDIDIKDQINILEKLGFVSKHLKDSNIEISIPTFRPDIEGSADIVEEIIRIYGFDKIEPIPLPKISNHNEGALNSNLKSFYKSKRLIANRGYLETVTYSFMDGEKADFITNNSSVKITNPISSDLNTMRPSIFPNLLSTINSNISRLYMSGKLFEVGPIFKGLGDDDQIMLASGIQYGLSNPSSWNNETRFADIYDIKSDVFYVLDQLNVPVENLQHEVLLNNIYHPGKSAQLKLGKNIVANFGEINPLILKKFDIKTTVSGFEIFLDDLDQFQIKKISTKKAYDNNPLQLVERDFAFLFSKDVKGIDIINKIKKIDKKIIKNVIIFDIFEGGKLPEDKKSIAFKVTLQPQDKTFTDSEIEIFSRNIINLISKSFDGELRQ